MEDRYILIDLTSEEDFILIDGNKVPYPVFNCLYEADMTALDKPSGSYDESYHMGRFNGILYLASVLCNVPASDIKCVYFELYRKKQRGETND